MRQPEVGTFANAPFIDENRLVLEPGLGLLSRPVHRFDDRRLSSELCATTCAAGAFEGVDFAMCVDELSDVRRGVHRGSGLGADAKERNNRGKDMVRAPADREFEARTLGSDELAV
jgi:hypothetical protein